MFATSAQEKQRLLSALQMARNVINSQKQQLSEEHDARVRAEKALALEQQRPLNYTCNVALPSAEEAESFYPKKGKYTEVVEWLEDQKTNHKIDYYAAAGMNRTRMCRSLSEIFKWEVNENSLRKAQAEAEKQKNNTFLKIGKNFLKIS